MQVPKRKSEQNRRRVQADNYLTAEKFKQISAKLENLKNIKQPQAIEEVKRLALEGDFSENVPYQMAKGRLRSINNQIELLEQQLQRAQIIVKNTNTAQVRVGHKVTIQANGRQRQYQILGSAETDPSAGIISRNSPLGQALLGSKVNEKVLIKLGGKTVQYTIINIE